MAEVPAPPNESESERERHRRIERLLASSTYRLATDDPEFLWREDLRPVRMLLELMKPELALEDARIESTVVVFGSTQIRPEVESRARLARCEAAALDSPGDPHAALATRQAKALLSLHRYYDQARQFSRLVSEACQEDGRRHHVVVTGGGPGIMEAANRGADDAGALSIGLNIALPAEQFPNPYVSPELCFQFHYFAMRKMHFLLRARALVVFPGGYGTLDELFDALTLRQTQRMQEIPILLFGREWWESVLNFDQLLEQGMIQPEHRKLVHFVETAEEAWAHIRCQSETPREQ